MNKSTLKHRVLRRLIAYLQGVLREDYLEKFHHDRKCENCGTWGADNDGFEDVREVDDRQFLTCKKCLHVSEWRVDSMIPVLIPKRIREAL